MWLLAILNRYSENDYGELNHENYTDKTISKYEIENLNLVAYGIEYGKRRTIYFDYDILCIVLVWILHLRQPWWGSTKNTRWISLLVYEDFNIILS